MIGMLDHRSFPLTDGRGTANRAQPSTTTRQHIYTFQLTTQTPRVLVQFSQNGWRW